MKPETLLVSELQISSLSHAYTSEDFKSFHMDYSPYQSLSSSNVCRSVAASFQPVPHIGSVSWSLVNLTIMHTPLIWHKVEETDLILEQKLSFPLLLCPARHKKQKGKVEPYTTVLVFLPRACSINQSYTRTLLYSHASFGV